jgi:hypothetical protein
MYLQIGYSNEPIASGSAASQSRKTKDLVRVPAPQYLDAVFVEVVPAASHRSGTYLTRAEAAIRLYSSIFSYREAPGAGLRVTA